MARPKKYKKQQVRDALTQAHGLMTGAAELLGSSFETVQRYMAVDPDARAIVDHWRKRRKDRAEYKLDEAIERGESWAVMFTLKNAKDREYSDRLDLSADGGLTFRVVHDEDERIQNPSPEPIPQQATGGDSQSGQAQGAGVGKASGEDED